MSAEDADDFADGDIDYTSNSTLVIAWEGFTSSCGPIETYALQLEKLSPTQGWLPLAIPPEIVIGHTATFNLPSDGDYRVVVTATTILGQSVSAHVSRFHAMVANTLI